MAKKPSLVDVTGRIVEITSGPPRELVERVVGVLQEYQHSPVEIRARAVIAAVQEVEVGQPSVPTQAESAPRRAMIDEALPDFERVVEETGILKPKP